jgi:hypothetical protein
VEFSVYVSCGFEFVDFGFLCNVCVSSSMSGRLVFILHAFQVMILSCDVECVLSFEVVCGV